MGISQLLPFLEKSTRNCHVSEFRGLTVAIDSYCWLHKGARACALQLAKGEKTDAYVQYCMKYVNMLLSYDIKPIMVFDGRPLPAKAGTENKRRESKAQARKQGMEYLRLGQTGDAYKCFCQCIDVTPEMALEVIRACRRIKVDCIVAPYESDAQLAFLNIKGTADCVISEDSDLLLFGCKKVLYKMDLNGAGQLVEADKLYLSMKMRREAYTFEKFRYMCILSGCDYLDSLPGIGLKKALKFFAMTAEHDPAVFLDRIPRYLNMKKLIVPEDYKENFRVANATFLHQIVFDPEKKVLTPLRQVDDKNAEYCRNSGQMFDQGEAFELAIGNLNPLTMEQIDNWDPSEMITCKTSIWCRQYTPRSKAATRYEPSQNVLCKRIDFNGIDKANKQSDEVVEKELEFYKSPVKVHVAIVEYNSAEPPKAPDSQISPVLGTNPFIKKKISKFRVTPENSQQKVISRFFSSNVVGMQAHASSFRSSESPLLSSESGYDAEEDQLGSSEVDVNSTTAGSDISLKVNTDFEFNTDEDSPDISDEPPQIECECILQEENVEFQPTPDPALASVENIPAERPSKNRKLQEQPRGRKRASRQATIQDMFKKMRMN